MKFKLLFLLVFVLLVGCSPATYESTEAVSPDDTTKILVTYSNGCITNIFVGKGRFVDGGVFFNDLRAENSTYSFDVVAHGEYIAYPATQAQIEIYTYAESRANALLELRTLIQEDGTVMPEPDFCSPE